MDSSFWFETKKLGIVHCTYLGVSGYNLKKILIFFCLYIFFTFTNSVDPDEMQHYAAFHLGLHCSRKYLSHTLIPFPANRLGIPVVHILQPICHNDGFL